jgi:hypothetical protein
MEEEEEEEEEEEDLWYPSTSCKACVIEGGFR